MRFPYAAGRLLHLQHADLARATAAHESHRVSDDRVLVDKHLLKDLREANAKLVRAALREQELTHDAERATAMRDELLAAVSHDVVSALAGIRMAAEALLMRIAAGDLSRTVLPLVEGIRFAAAHTTEVVDGLADVAAIQLGRMDLVLEEHDIVDLVDRALSMQRPVAGAKQTRLRREPGDACVAQVDPVRVVRILHNLVGNAVKYTPRDGTVVVRVVARGDLVEVSVVDDGPGILTAELPGRQAGARSETRAPGGRGIGLMIVQELVRWHGGELTVETPPAGGTRVAFTLPSAQRSP